MQGSYRLKGATLEEIRAKALAKYGPGARIVSADLVTSQGVAGLFAGSRYEAVVQIAASEPAPGAPAGVVARAAAVAATAVPANAATAVPANAAEAVTANAAEALPGPVQAPHRLHRSAIAGLLAAADATDATEVKTTAPPAAVSTETPDFAKVLEQFTALAPPVATTVATTAPGAGPAPAAAAVQVAATVPRPSGPGGRRARQAATAPAPASLTGAGDLIILLGLGTDALDVALAMSLDRGGADVRTAGQLTAFGHLHVAGRLDATAARAQAVENGQIVILAFGLGKRPDIPRAAPAVNALRGDQAWAVVDAGRKSADSLAWLEPLGAAVDLTAVVAVGLAGTGSPETVLDLGWPISHPHGLD